MTTDIFAAEWRLLEAGETEEEWNACHPLTICAGLEDLATVYSEEDSTVNISRQDAIRAAYLFAAAPDLEAALDALVTSLSQSDADTRRQFASALSAGELALRRARIS
jgi:hypothetical protein